MPKIDRFRALYVLKYLWEHTDEEHPVTLAQIQNHLLEQGIATWLFYIYFHFSVIFFTFTSARPMLHWSQRKAKKSGVIFHS